jgi:O-antigen/teichoic acid export membrane protein
MTAEREEPSLPARVITSSFWAVGANVAVAGVVVARSIVLARLLRVETFGVYALAASIVAVTSALPRFGLGSALLHRSDETSDEQHAARIHFTLIAGFSSLWAVTQLTIASRFTSGMLWTSIAVLTLSRVALHLSSTPQILLERRVTHRPIAAVRFVSASASAAIAMILAVEGYEIAALLAVDVTLSVAALTYFYLWRPSFGWHGPTVRYFLRFGSRSLAGNLLQESIVRADKLWIGVLMNRLALGLYSRAYAYSAASAGVLTRPLGRVSLGAYAELKDKRQELSRVVARTLGLVFRWTCMVTGVAMVAAPELVLLLIGSKWLPMVEPFRVLLVASVVHPINQSLSHLLVASGQPNRVMWIRLAQLAVLITALGLLGPRFGLVGIGVGVVANVACGLVLLLHSSRAHVDFSRKRVFVTPLVSWGASIALALLVDYALVEMAALASGLVKSSVFLGSFLVLLSLFEGPVLHRIIAESRAYLTPRGISSYEVER